MRLCEFCDTAYYDSICTAGGAGDLALVNHSCRVTLKKRLDAALLQLSEIETTAGLWNAGHLVAVQAVKKIYDLFSIDKPKSEVSGRGNCSECGALVEHLYSLRCPACYDKLVAGMEKRKCETILIGGPLPNVACGAPMPCSIHAAHGQDI